MSVQHLALADLLDAPERAMELRPVEAVRLLAQVGALAEVLRLAAGQSGHEPEKPADMLTVDEAANLAGVTIAEFYRRKVFRPAIVKLGHRTRRVSGTKLRRILAETRP